MPHVNMCRDEDSYLFWKNKSIAPVIASQYSNATKLRTAETYDRNYLLQGIASPYDLHLGRLKVASQLNREYWEHSVSMAIKPEAKKPSPRIFFMATAQDRLILSEFDKNVARLVAKKPGSSAGKTPSLCKASKLC